MNTDLDLDLDFMNDMDGPSTPLDWISRDWEPIPAQPEEQEEVRNEPLAAPAAPTPAIVHDLTEDLSDAVHVEPGDSFSSPITILGEEEEEEDAVEDRLHNVPPAQRYFTKNKVRVQVQKVLTYDPLFETVTFAVTVPVSSCAPAVRATLGQ